MREAIAQGIAYLENQQVPASGRIGSRYPVATTSLAGLAVLGAGIHPHRPPYDRMLEGCVRYLLQSADTDGYISESDRGTRIDSGSRMHGHCYAILFLTQIVGSLSLETEEKVRAAIQRGVKVIERSQSREGGWWYTSRNDSNRDEASVTVCAVQSLRAARNTGFVIDPRVIREGIRYVVRCQGASGAFRYSLSERQTRSSYALTAAAVSTLNAAGIYEAANMGKPTEALHRGLDYLHRSVGSWPEDPERAAKNQFFYYGNLYAAQALFQEGGASWNGWYAKVSENLLHPDLRRSQGGVAWWHTPEGESPYGNEYATAVALLILEIPLGYLPIFQR